MEENYTNNTNTFTLDNFKLSLYDNDLSFNFQFSDEVEDILSTVFSTNQCGDNSCGGCCHKESCVTECCTTGAFIGEEEDFTSDE